MRQALGDTIWLFSRNPCSSSPERNRVCRTKTRMVVPLSLHELSSPQRRLPVVARRSILLADPVSRRLHLVTDGPDLHGLALDLVRRHDPPPSFLHSAEDLLQGVGEADPRTRSRPGARRVGSGFHEDVANLDGQPARQLMVVFRERMRTAPRSAHHRRLRILRRRRQPARIAANGVQPVAFFTQVDSEAEAWKGGETAQARLAPRPGEAFRRQEGHQPPDLADGHVARGDRPTLGLANRTFRQQ